MIKSLIKKAVLSSADRYDEWLYKQVRDRWLIDDFNPIMALSKSSQHYKLTEFATHEVYEGPKQVSLHPADYSQVRLNLQPVVMPAPYYFRVKDAIADGFSVADPARPDGAILESYADVKWFVKDKHWRDRHRRQRPKLLQKFASRPADLEEAYLFGTRGWDNYYHFLIDACAKYVEMDDHGLIPDDMPLLVPEPLRGFQETYLPLLGIDPARIKVTKSDPQKVGSLLISSPRRQVYVVSSAAVMALRARVLKNLQVTQTGGSRKLYVSRQSASTRRILNHDKVLGVLDAHGVETFSPEGKSVPEQIAAFAQADTIVAPHGAGLVNMMYADKPKLIELIPMDLWDYGYFLTLSGAVSADYTGLISKPENEQRDFTVDIDQLRAALEA